MIGSCARRELGNQLAALVEIVPQQLNTRGLGSCPREDAIRKLEVAWGIDLFPRDNDADDGLLSFVLDSDVVLVEGNLNAVRVHFVVHDGSIVDVSFAHSRALGPDDKEILEGLCTVEGEGKVSKVVTKLHGLIVHAVHPASQHGNLGRRYAGFRVAGILEVLHVDGLIRLCGVEVGRDAGAKQYLAAA